MKYLIFTLIFITSLYANIDERKIDIYYINDLFVDKDSAKDNKEELNKFIQRGYLSNEEYLSKHTSFDLAFNYDKIWWNDVLEIVHQYIRNGQIENDYRVLLRLISSYGRKGLVEQTAVEISNEQLALLNSAFENKSYIREIEDDNIDDLYNQIKSYSLKSSHRIAVVSFGQGGFFSNGIYRRLNNHNKYFKNLQIATRTNRVESLDPHITLSTDKITQLPFLDILQGDYNNTDGYTDHTLSDYLSGNDTGPAILGIVSSQIKELSKLGSQWSIKDENNKGTCTYRVELTNDVDTSIDNLFDVYPFNKDGLVYTVNEMGKTKSEYVKGTKEGQEIESFIWDYPKDNCEKYPTDKPCYTLTKTSDEIKPFFNASKYKVLFEYEKGTCNHRVSVQDLYSGELYAEVYPFSTNGSYLYQVVNESNETNTVLSQSCQGTQIKLTVPEHECYELENTSEKIYQDLTITKTEVINECKTERITGSKGYSYWEDFCDYSVVINDWIKSEWDWVDDSLKPCEFPKEDGVSFSKEVPEGYSLKEESMSESNTAKLVYDSTNENAVDVAYIVGQARCYSSLLRGSSSSIKYQATVNKGYETSQTSTGVYSKD
ncbi:MAG: Unknown protein [uncultured Campylobacterales bacterium]|uniref:Uncharacterized protein n=1 Tax=uncultured Campylobacterales bacterium TaxID=352960 RepID=A0A6S6S881_9BACT|nr:MAG: Unknown protein [uncultured Campylobacterales bacterium]